MIIRDVQFSEIRDAISRVLLREEAGPASLPGLVVDRELVEEAYKRLNDVVGVLREKTLKKLAETLLVEAHGLQEVYENGNDELRGVLRAVIRRAAGAEPENADPLEAARVLWRYVPVPASVNGVYLYVFKPLGRELGGAVEVSWPDLYEAAGPLVERLGFSVGKNVVFNLFGEPLSLPEAEGLRALVALGLAAPVREYLARKMLCASIEILGGEARLRLRPPIRLAVSPARPPLLRALKRVEVEFELRPEGGVRAVLRAADEYRAYVLGADSGDYDMKKLLESLVSRLSREAGWSRGVLGRFRELALRNNMLYRTGDPRVLGPSFYVLARAVDPGAPGVVLSVVYDERAGGEPYVSVTAVLKGAKRLHIARSIRSIGGRTDFESRDAVVVVKEYPLSRAEDAFEYASRLRALLAE